MNTYHKQILTNGLTLLTIPMPHVESATVMLMVGAGSRYEEKRINGLSHFLEHMAFKGSKKRPTALQIASTIDGIGGEFNAFTSKDHTGYYIKAHKKHTELLVDVISDMLLQPILSEEEIEREKGVIIEEINMYEDTPMRHIGDIYEELMYGDHPLGWDTAGKPDIIRSIKRTDFVDYLDRLYRPNNAVLVIAGGGLDVAPGNAELNLVNKYFSNWKKHDVSHYIPSSAKQDKPRVRLQYKATEQAHLVLGVPAFSMNDPKRFTLNVLSVILGGGMSSRMFIEVRERRGLAYYVHADASQYQDVGNFTTQAGVDVKRIDEAISVILEEYLLLASGKKPILKEELLRAKESIKGHLALELEDSRSVAGYFATQEILKRKILTAQEVIAKTDAVTLDEVNAVAKELLQLQKMNLAVIGPYKDEKRFVDLVK